MLKSGFVLPRPILLVLTALGLLFAIDLFALAAYRELEQACGELTEAAAGSARNWLSGYASPLVVTRSAGDNRQRTMTAILKIMRNNQGESQIE